MVIENPHFGPKSNLFYKVEDDRKAILEVLETVERINNELNPRSLTLTFEEIPVGVRRTDIFKYFNCGAFWYRFAKDATDLTPGSSPSISTEIREAQISTVR